MLDRLLGRGAKELKAAYIPKLNDIEQEVSILIANFASNGELQNRLISLAGTSIIPDFHVYVIKREEYGGNVSIMTPGTVEPVLKISPGADQAALIATNKSNGILNFWNLKHDELKGRGDLGEAVRKIVFGEAKLEQYDLNKREGLQKSGVVEEERHDSGFTREKKK